MNAATVGLESSSSGNSPCAAGVLLAGRLRSWREQNNVPIKCAAAELGVSAACWDHWEKGRRFPSMADLNRLAQYLDLPPCLLFCHFKRSPCADCPEKVTARAIGR